MGNIITFNVATAQKKVIDWQIPVHCRREGETGIGSATIGEQTAVCSGTLTKAVKDVAETVGITLTNFTLVLKKSIWNDSVLFHNNDWIPSFNSSYSSRCSSSLTVGSTSKSLGYKPHNKTQNLEYPVSSLNDTFKISIGSVYSFLGDVNDGTALSDINEGLTLEFVVKETGQEFTINFV